MRGIHVKQRAMTRSLRLELSNRAARCILCQPRKWDRLLWRRGTQDPATIGPARLGLRPPAPNVQTVHDVKQWQAATRTRVAKWSNGDIVAFGDRDDAFASFPASEGFRALVPRKLRFSSKPHSVGHGARPTLAGSLADQFALEL